MSSSLLDKIRRRIESEGPIGVADYMEMALSDPEHGYYATRDPFGAKGDFITAPEVSQMFGEIIGLWAAHMWQALDRPAPFVFVELGPGRGTLMADMLRAAAVAPGFSAAVRVHLVETSPALRKRQEAALESAKVPVSWHDRLADVPAGPAILIANEFFDALPVQQFVRGERGWRERAVGLHQAGDLVWQTVETAETLAEFETEKEGAIVEVSPQRVGLAHDIGARLVQAGGAALIVDYGYSGPAAGDTFQAVKGHAYADPLQDPGEADLTAHVDFAALCEAARAASARAYGPIAQSTFLFELGIAARAERLTTTRPDHSAEIEAALVRLTAPGEMGTLFKAIALTGPDGPPPPPFAGD